MRGGSAGPRRRRGDRRRWRVGGPHGRAGASEAGARVIVERRRGYGRALLSGIAALSPRASVVLVHRRRRQRSSRDDPGRPGTDRAGKRRLCPGLAPARAARARQPGSGPDRGGTSGGYFDLPALWCSVHGHVAVSRDPARRARRASACARRPSAGTSRCRCVRRASRLRVVEVPVGQRRRAGGVSKVSGNLRTAVHVAWVLLTTFLRLSLRIERNVLSSKG